MQFSCSKCGICCNLIGKTVEIAKQNVKIGQMWQEVANFPHGYDENGRCSKLSLENECTVYDERPDMCNVTVFHEKYFSNYSKLKFFRMNELECINLQNNQHGK